MISSNLLIDVLKKASNSYTLEERTKAKLGLAKNEELLEKSTQSLLKLNTDQDQSFNGEELTSESNAHPLWNNHHTDLFHGLKTDKDYKPQTQGITKFVNVFKKPSGESIIAKAPLDWKELQLDDEKGGPRPSLRSSHYSWMLHPHFKSTHREAAFHRVADSVFGLGDFVPKTTVFLHPKTREPWSAQEYIDNPTPFNPKERSLEPYESSGQLHKLALMDAILGNNDRHSKNVILDQTGKPKLIDNALTFDYSHRYGTPIPSYASHLTGVGIPSSVHKWIQGLDDKKLQEELHHSGAPYPIIATALNRLKELKRWSRTTSANPDFSQDLGGAISLMQTHRFNKTTSLPVDFNEIRKALYNRIKRGESFRMGSAEPESKTEKVGR